MTESSQDNSEIPMQANRTREDLTGRDRLVSNVIFTWAAHFVFIVAGFIMPRIIDRQLGQELLGVWDFAWSIVTYFGLVQMGITSSVNRYVARYRAANNISGVNQTVSSASCILGIAGLVVIMFTISASLLLPQLFGSRLGENVRDAQWVVFFLGISIAVEVSFGAFCGVLTGCHRWGLHNMIKSGWHVMTIAAMIVALLYGGSLPSLALITFVGLALEYMTRVIISYRVCKGLRLRSSLVTWEMIGKLYFFGGKTLIPSISNLLLNQTTGVLIVIYLGPAALALYARPRALVLHIYTLVNKMAMVTSPTSSSLQSIGNLEGIRELLIRSVRYSFYMVLPMVLVLVVFGGPILQLWMGQRYANSLLPAVLALGYLTTMVQAPLMKILGGMNAHGRAGIAHLISSLFSVGLTVLVLGYLGLGLTGAAVALTLPLTILNIVYLPRLICRRVGLNVSQYFLSVVVKPIVYILPFGVCLAVARLVFRAEPLLGLALGGLIGGTVLAILYWLYALPKSLCIKIRVKIKALLLGKVIRNT